MQTQRNGLNQIESPTATIGLVADPLSRPQPLIPLLYSSYYRVLIRNGPLHLTRRLGPVSMLRMLRRLSSASSNPAATPATQGLTPTMFPPSMSAIPSRKLQLYETPPSSGTCHLVNLPDQVLASIFTRLDRVSFTRCHRVRLPLPSLASRSSNRNHGYSSARPSTSSSRLIPSSPCTISYYVTLSDCIPLRQPRPEMQVKYPYLPLNSYRRCGNDLPDSGTLRRNRVRSLSLKSPKGGCMSILKVYCFAELGEGGSCRGNWLFMI